MIITLGDALKELLENCKKTLDFEKQVRYNMRVEKQKGSKMDRILANEIKKFIGRFPSEEELKSAKEHIDFYCGEDARVEDIKGSISDWLDDKMVECENCGKWHMREKADVRNGFYFCDNDCADEYEDSTYDMHAEAKAEYYATHK